MRKVIFWLWFLNGLVQGQAQQLSLTVPPTVTQNEVVATWSWSGGPVFLHVPLVLAIVQESQTVATTITTPKVTGPTQGTIPFTISEPGSFQAILSAQLHLPAFSVQTTASFTSISPPTPTAQTTPSATANPASLTSSSIESDTTNSLTSASSVRPTSASSLLITTSSISSILSTATSTNNSGPILSTITESGTTVVTTVVSSPITTTNVKTTSALTSATAGASNANAHPQHSIALLVGSILGAVVAFLLLASLVYCLWRRRRTQREMTNMNVTFYPDQMMAIPSKSVAPSDWDDFDDASSLAPSDSVSRAMHSFPEKIRPLAPSTTMTTVSEQIEFQAESITSSETMTMAGQYSTSLQPGPVDIPAITHTAATPSPPSTNMG